MDAPPLSNPFSLRGRTALVTGGTQGVGGAIALALARAGADLVLHGLSDDAAAQSSVQQCRALGVRVDLVCLDLRGEGPADLVERPALDLFARATDLNPAIDSLVNNAGIYMDTGLENLSGEIFNRTFQVNVASGLFLTQAFARRWTAAGQGGRVLFTGSINGLLSEPEHVTYDASKGAVAAMVRSLCVELAPKDIRVNAIAPGLIRTPLTQRALDSGDGLDRWMRLHTPNGQVPGPDVCGPPAVFLLSDAAMHVHGQTLYIDGGMSAWQQPNPPAA